ncbi:MAG: hypothetical protein HC929_10135 [Leptolyngbyaceae cyanobacterium SM2_5_2]|nr:hypothetical protein [Leptolyngbyaceae cyanobacterium SM2_5_2]
MKGTEPDPNTATGLGTPVLPLAPAPVIPDPEVRRFPRLPLQLETVPGDDPMLPPTPNDPAAQPSPLPNVEDASPPSDPALTAPAPLAPTTPTPLPAPVPVSPAPGVPTAPSSELPSTGTHQSESDRQSSAPVLTPAVSVQPQPEQVMTPQVNPEPDVIYTGALYTGF